MKKSKWILTVTMMMLCGVSALTLYGCNNVKTLDGGVTTEVTDVEEPLSEITVPADEDMYSENDLTADTLYADKLYEISLNGTTASCDSADVTISGSTVTITGKGSYKFTGTLTDGQIIVNVDDKNVQIILDGANISTSHSAAILVLNAKNVFITTLANSTVSALGQDESVDDSNVDGAVFSKTDLTLNGAAAATLTVTSAYGNGIVGKDDLKFTSGNYDITSAGHGVDANDSVCVTSADITISSGKDGIHCENDEDTEKGYVYVTDGTLNVTSALDGVSASSALVIKSGDVTVAAGGGSALTYSGTDSKKGLKATSNLVILAGTVNVNSADDAIHSNGSIQIDGGTLNLSSGDDGIHADSVLLINGGAVTITKSYEGLEGKSVTVKGGTVNITASDDGINSAGGSDQTVSGRPGANSFAVDGSVFVTISGGNITVNAAGDGIDSNGNLYVSGGTLIVFGPVSSGNGTLDFEGTAQITGGTVVALGSSGMAANFSAASQGAIMVNLSSMQAANGVVKLCDSNGNVLVSVTAAKQYSSVIVSTPDVSNSGKYTLTAGSYSTTVSMNGYIYGSQSGVQPGGEPGGRF